MGALEASKSIKIWSKMEPRRFLRPFGRTRRAREAKMGALEASPREFGGALEALWTRLERLWGARRGPGSPKWMQNRYKFLSKRVSVTVSGPDLVRHTFFDSFRNSSLQ